MAVTKYIVLLFFVNFTLKCFGNSYVINSTNFGASNFDTKLLNFDTFSCYQIRLKNEKTEKFIYLHFFYANKNKLKWKGASVLKFQKIDDFSKFSKITANDTLLYVSGNDSLILIKNFFITSLEKVDNKNVAIDSINCGEKLDKKNNNVSCKILKENDVTRIIMYDIKKRKIIKQIYLDDTLTIVKIEKVPILNHPNEVKFLTNFFENEYEFEINWENPNEKPKITRFIFQ